MPEHQSMPVNGAHYIESTITAPGIALRDYPDQAYTWDKIVANEKQASRWRWTGRFSWASASS